MSIISDFFLALNCKKDLTFSVAWKRIRCMNVGHAYGTHKIIQTRFFDKHPQNDELFKYSVTLFRCSHCCMIDTKNKFEIIA